MNILISGIFSYDSYSRGIMPDVLQTQIDQNPGAKIFYLSNSGSFDICYFNIEKRPEVCYRCKTGLKNTLGLIEGRFNHITISQITRSDDFIQANSFYKDKNRISFDQVFEDFEVGAATLSTYISKTRDRDLTSVDQPFVKELAVNSIALYLAVQRFIQENQISVVYNFNGRQEYVRAVMRAALSRGIPCYNVERTRLRGSIDFYKNTFPHDPEYKFYLIQKYWTDSSFSEKEKEKKGASFFLRQKAGESIVFPSYTGGMNRGYLPAQALRGSKNLVVFNSSDDETVAFGDLYKIPFFESQNEGLRYLVDLVGKELKEYNLIIRMHPNLAGVRHEFVKEIRNFHQKYPNILVIEPESPVDSYALLREANKVISFGSTMGLEANFAGKPVILLGIGFFYHADYAYKPRNFGEISELLKADLEPRPVQDTLKVGYYLTEGGVKTKYYYEEKMGEGVFFKGKRIHFFTLYQRLKAKVIEIFWNHFHLRIKF